MTVKITRHQAAVAKRLVRNGPESAMANDRTMLALEREGLALLVHYTDAAEKWGFWSATARALEGYGRHDRNA